MEGGGGARGWRERAIAVCVFAVVEEGALEEGTVF